MGDTIRSFPSRKASNIRREADSGSFKYTLYFVKTVKSDQKSIGKSSESIKSTEERSISGAFLDPFFRYFLTESGSRAA